MLYRIFPKDIIELIIFHVFKDTHAYHNGYRCSLENDKYWKTYSIYEWLDYWVRNSIEQTLNPLQLALFALGLDRPEIIKKLGVEQCSTMFIDNVVPDKHANIYSTNLTKQLSYVIGIAFNDGYDVSNIEECSIYLNCLKLRSNYVFKNEFTVKVRRAEFLPFEVYYFNPKFRVIPTGKLHFNNVGIQMKIKNGKRAPQFIKVLHVNTVHPQEYIIIINQNDPEHEMIVSNGTCRYRKDEYNEI